MVHISSSKALRWALATAVTSAVVVGLPVLAQSTLPTNAQSTVLNSTFAQNIVSSFSNPAADQPSHYDNTTLETSAFDFQSYMRDTCFRPTEYDMRGCELRFGPYANLRETLTSGKLFTILHYFGILSTKDQALVLSVQAGLQQTEIRLNTAREPSSQQMYERMRDSRAAQVWQTCKERYGSRGDESLAKSCYQRNVRLVYRHSVPVEENVF